MKKTLTLLFILSAFLRPALAQDFPFGKISDAEMDMKNYARDTSAHALVLNEFGSARIAVTGDDDEIKLIYDYHVKIKIFDAKGFDAATVAIPINNNKDGNYYDDMQKVQGVTYYRDANGLTQRADFDPKKVYTTRNYKYRSTSKFTLPGLVNGCVIEYSYTVFSPFYYDHFHPWEFQGDYPKLHSEFHALIPATYTYNALLRGPLKLTGTKEDIEHACFTIHGASSDCSAITYFMNDIPAFNREEDMTSAKNFISAISFDLVEHYNVYTNVTEKVTKDWKSIDYELKQSPYFGEQLKRRELLKERITPVIANKTDDLGKARAIYVYLQKWFKWNDYIGYESDGIKKALDSHSGSVADINISLVAALNSAGINTEAVLLSTRDNGVVNTLYPALNDFNYVIAKATIGDQTYFLDATDPLLGFGMLPMRCLNDKGRVFSLDKPSYWVDLNIPQKRKFSETLDLTLGDNGKLKGTYIRYTFDYAGYEKRAAIKKFNSTDEYVEAFNAATPRIKILKSEITNVDSLEAPLVEKYDIEFDIYDKLTGSLTFNPFFWNKIRENPYKLNERTYPVDRGIATDERFVLSIHLPDQYVIETPPQAIGIGMPNNGGKFLTDYQPGDNSFTFSHIVQFNKPIYSSEEYPYLKELYNKIIQSEKIEMVFKKKI